MGSSTSKSIDEANTADIATYVSSLGNNFKAYEDSIRQSGLDGKELALMDEDALECVLNSLSVNNRLHRRKLMSVCRRSFHQFPIIDVCGDCDTCSSTTASCSSSHHNHNHNHSSTSCSPPMRRRPSLKSLCSLPDCETSKTSLQRYSSFGSHQSATTAGAGGDDASLCGGGGGGSSVVSNAFENFAVATCAEALSLLVDMENQKRLLSHNSRPDGPPEGKAAIILTDVEGSTELWEADPVAMRAALNLHDDIMRMIRADHGGYEVDTEGDAFYMAFHSAKDALSFAVALQEALREAAWPKAILAHPKACEDGTNRGLRVRIAIHMGPVTTRRNAVTGRIEYTGETMDKAREIEGMVQGGQILTTRSTFEAASIAALVEDKGDGLVQVCLSQREAGSQQQEQQQQRESSRGRRPSVSSVRSLRSWSSDKRLSSRLQKRRSTMKKSVAGGEEAARSSSRTRRMKRSVSMPTAAAAAAAAC